MRSGDGLITSEGAGYADCANPIGIVLRRVCRGVLHRRKSCRKSFFVFVVRVDLIIGAGRAAIGTEFTSLFQPPQGNGALLCVCECTRRNRSHLQELAFSHHKEEDAVAKPKNKVIHAAYTSLKQPLRDPLSSSLWQSSHQRCTPTHTTFLSRCMRSSQCISTPPTHPTTTRHSRPGLRKSSAEQMSSGCVRSFITSHRVQAATAVEEARCHPPRCKGKVLARKGLSDYYQQVEKTD